MNIKPYILFIFLLVISFSAVAKKKKPLFKESPPGTVMISDSLYIDKHPIRVIDYLEFLHDIRNSYTPKLHDSINKLPLYNLNPQIPRHLYDSLPMDSLFYKRMLTRTWQVVSSDKKVYGIDYHLLSSRYYNYPLVNIGYYQIFEYCKWRTDKVKLYYAVKCKTLKQRKKYPINFIYRQVRRKEWEKTLSIFFEEVKTVSKSLSNISMVNAATPYVSENKKKPFYYESDNVGEYLAGDIVAVGFNWKEEYGIGDISYVKYTKPTDWIGFRAMFEVLPDTINKPIIVKEELSKPIKNKKPKSKPSKKKTDKKLKGINNEDINRRRK